MGEYALAQLWRSEANFRELASSFYSVDLRDRTRLLDFNTLNGFISPNGLLYGDLSQVPIGLRRSQGRTD